MIELTDAHRAMFPAWVEKWTQVGTSTEPADFERAKIAASSIYTIMNSKQPRDILFASSPFEAVNKAHDVCPEVAKSNFVHCFFGGSFYASWASFVTFFRDNLDFTNDKIEDFKQFEELVLSCNMVLWHEDVCVIVDRPEIISFDDENRLHGENGPAIKYRDGWTVCAWHGTQVPREWILDKENLDPRTALTWENVEQRRCAAEIIGWNNVLEMLDVKIIDQDDPSIGTLVEVDLPEIGKERFLKVLCGTGRTFALPVPPDKNTALEAQADLWGMSVEEFEMPEIRT